MSTPQNRYQGIDLIQIKEFNLPKIKRASSITSLHMAEEIASKAKSLITPMQRRPNSNAKVLETIKELREEKTQSALKNKHIVRSQVFQKVGL